MMEPSDPVNIQNAIYVGWENLLCRLLQDYYGYVQSDMLDPSEITLSRCRQSHNVTISKAITSSQLQTES